MPENQYIGAHYHLWHSILRSGFADWGLDKVIGVSLEDVRFQNRPYIYTVYILGPSPSSLS